MCNKINITKINLKQISIYKNKLSENIHEKCRICDKFYEISLKTKKLNKKLYKKRNLCSFCLKNDFSKKVFIFNLKEIPVFLFLKAQKNKNNLEIKKVYKYIESHIKTGFKNPLFFYDHDTMNWFVDLSKKQICKQEIKKTILEIFLCFNLYDTIPEMDQELVAKKILSSCSFL